MSRDEAVAPSSSPAPVGGRAEPGYLQRRFPVSLILASFFLLTVPLCVLARGDDQFVFRRPIGIVYICALGMTHFVITFVLYLQAANLRYFWSTWANRLTYFVVPGGHLRLLRPLSRPGGGRGVPLLDLGLMYGIRLMDFQHFTRQNYGVLQLFRIRSGERFPDWMRQAENQFFSGLTLLLFVTFLCGGRFRPERPIVLMVLAVVTGLFVWVLAGFALAWSRSRTRSALLVPLAYFLLQTCSAGLAVYSTSLYAFGLAMHYVEYHVLMIPRCFHTPLDAHGADRPVVRPLAPSQAPLLRSAAGPGRAGHPLCLSGHEGLFQVARVVAGRSLATLDRRLRWPLCLSLCHRVADLEVRRSLSTGSR